jgi:hypothetical protein
MVRFVVKHACAKTQTAAWRSAQSWYRGGRRNECENYQRAAVETIARQPCLKTHVRINTVSSDIRECTRPLLAEDGFEWTENFDGVLRRGTATVFVNMKFVCSQGGSQTRTLREVYHFVRAQAACLDAPGAYNTYFVNILEGDACAAAADKFGFALARAPRAAAKRIFVGDMAAFAKFWRGIAKH